MTEQMPDVIYIRNGQVHTVAGRAPFFGDKYLKASHVEATTVPKAEHDTCVSICNALEIDLNDADGDDIDPLTWTIERIKATTVPRDKVEALVKAAERAIYKDTSDSLEDICDAMYSAIADIRSLEDKG